MTYYITDPDVVRWFIWYRKVTWKKHKGKGKVFMQWRGGEPHWQPYSYEFFTSEFYRDVAKLLGRDDWDDFTGHSMCRTAASVFAANGMYLYLHFSDSYFLLFFAT